MIRITTEDHRGSSLIRLAGQLTVDDLVALDEVCGAASGPLRFELSELLGTDEAGKNALRELFAKGATVLGASPYIALRLGISPTAGRGRSS